MNKKAITFSHTGRDLPINFFFVLLDNFTLLSLAAAIDSLRLANQLSGRTLFSWTMVGEKGPSIKSSSGMPIQLDKHLPETNRGDYIVICGGVDIQSTTTSGVVNWLRREARKGVVIAGISTGAYTLASSGLLSNKKATIHWELHDLFEELFPSTDLMKTSYEIDGKRLTAAGGTSPIDMCLSIISDEFGEELAFAVADQLLYTEIRDTKLTNRLSLSTRLQTPIPKLNHAIELMEAHIEEPLHLTEVANAVGLSQRQLERLFLNNLERTPKKFYIELRLQKARNLLMQTELKIIDIAVICGFVSAGHFSKVYKQHYKKSPSFERSAIEKQL
jgi:transcriptional regulator GlxA family with amidase domain